MRLLEPWTACSNLQRTNDGGTKQQGRNKYYAERAGGSSHEVLAQLESLVGILCSSSRLPSCVQETHLDSTGTCRSRPLSFQLPNILPAVVFRIKLSKRLANSFGFWRDSSMYTIRMRT
jgi:hypothetical protein